MDGREGGGEAIEDLAILLVERLLEIGQTHCRLHCENNNNNKKKGMWVGHPCFDPMAIMGSVFAVQGP